MEAELGRVGHELAERDIVLVHTGRDRFVDEPGYMALGPAVTAEATLWLYERGVRVMGIDAWGWDGPLHLQAQEALERDEPGIFWAAHQADIPYSQIERLVNLGELPADRLPGGLLPAQDRGRERRAGSRRGAGPLAPSATPAPYLHLSQMSVLDQVQDDVKTALKAGDRERVHALRLIADELQKAEKDNGGEPTRGAPARAQAPPRGRRGLPRRRARRPRPRPRSARRR